MVDDFLHGHSLQDVRILTADLASDLYQDLFHTQRSFLPLTFNVGMVRGPLEGGYGSVRFIGSETQISQRGKSNFLHTNTIGIGMWGIILFGLISSKINHLRWM